MRTHSFARSFTLALALVAAVSACDGPHGLSESDLIQAAPNITADGLLAGIELEPADRDALRHKVESLHAVMMEAHDLHGEGEPSDEAMRAIHDKLADVHERHEDLMASFTADQREIFFENAHKIMAEHADGAEAEGHDKMRMHLEHGGHDGDSGH